MNMPDSMIAPLISTIGVLISVIVSVMVARLQNKTELEKIKKELEQQYARSLFEERVKSYPELHALLSGYAKIIQYKKGNIKNLTEFRNALDEWNNKYSIFFTESTARLSGKFRYYLTDLASDGNGSKIEAEDLDATKKMIRAFEDSIRAEIGVIDTPPAGTLRELDKVFEFIDTRRASLGGGRKQ
jgi:hypothetical protein